jgi:hypothetical protein
LSDSVVPVDVHEDVGLAEVSLEPINNSAGFMSSTAALLKS